MSRGEGGSVLGPSTLLPNSPPPTSPHISSRGAKAARAHRTRTQVNRGGFFFPPRDNRRKSSTDPARDIIRLRLRDDLSRPRVSRVYINLLHHVRPCATRVCVHTFHVVHNIITPIIIIIIIIKRAFDKKRFRRISQSNFWRSSTPRIAKTRTHQKWALTI